VWFDGTRVGVAVGVRQGDDGTWKLVVQGFSGHCRDAAKAAPKEAKPDGVPSGWRDQVREKIRERIGDGWSGRSGGWAAGRSGGDH
jgi:hypothetical protein